MCILVVEGWRSKRNQSINQILIDWFTSIVKSRLLERSFPFLEIPLNQQTKTLSSGQIQLSQSLKLNPPLFQSLCTVSDFPFLSAGFHWKAMKGSRRQVRFIFPFSEFIWFARKTEDQMSRLSWKRKPETELKKSISFPWNIFLNGRKVFFMIFFSEFK